MKQKLSFHIGIVNPIITAIFNFFQVSLGSKQSGDTSLHSDNPPPGRLFRPK